MDKREIYRNASDQEVTIELPVSPTQFQVSIESAGGKTEALIPELNGRIFTFEVPFKHLKYDGPVNVAVDFEHEQEEHTLNYQFQVVTPVLTADDFSDKQLAQLGDSLPELERLVRHVIEAHTGQQFGYFKETYYVSPNTRRLTFRAPMRIFSGTSDVVVTGAVTPNMPFVLYDDGLTAVFEDDHHIKTDTILFPGAAKRTRMREISGVFGYLTVPEGVRQAALLIAGMWGCDQTKWADRYIKTIRSADWNVTYDGGAYTGTGSARADLLLAPYVVNGGSYAAVI